jgi:hypothetical protein
LYTANNVDEDTTRKVPVLPLNLMPR